MSNDAIGSLTLDGIITVESVRRTIYGYTRADILRSANFLPADRNATLLAAPRRKHRTI